MSKYDPRKQYTWMNDERFVISGRDLGMFMNAFRAILNTEEAARILLASRANEAIEGIIAEYVEKDVIKEVKPEQPQMRVEKGKKENGKREKEKQEVDSENNSLDKKEGD